MAQQFLHAELLGAEAMVESHLKHTLGPYRSPRDGIGVFQRQCQRLFAEHVSA